VLLAFDIAKVRAIARLVQDLAVYLGEIWRNESKALQVANQLRQGGYGDDLDAGDQGRSGASSAGT